jgi:Zn-dependent peptidase ImmA (M78 family)
MPRAEMLHDPRVAHASPTTRWTDEALGQLADMYGVSREAMLLRLIELDRASWDYYFERRPYFLRKYEEVQEDKKVRKGGPSYYRMKLRDFGRRYVTTVLDAYHRDVVTSSDLSDYLDIKVNKLAGLEAELAKQR